jgi:hypothetical protein
MLETLRKEIAYKCAVCGELFNSPAADAHNLNQDIYVKSMSNDGITGTNTPAEDREQERAMQIPSFL